MNAVLDFDAAAADKRHDTFNAEYWNERSVYTVHSVFMTYSS